MYKTNLHNTNNGFGIPISIQEDHTRVHAHCTVQICRARYHLACLPNFVCVVRAP